MGGLFFSNKKHNEMNAINLEANKVLKSVELDVPTIKPDEYLIKMKVCGICSSDIYRAFENGAYFYPLVMGHELSGEVVKKGKDTNGFGIGEAVSVFPLLPCFKCNSCKEKKYATCSNYKYYGSRNSGGFSEYIAVKEWNLIKIGAIGYSNAALIEPLSVVVHGLKKLSLLKRNGTIELKDKKVCIIGSGFLGLLMSEIIYNKLGFKEIHVIDRNQFKLNNLSLFSDKIVTHFLDDINSWKQFTDHAVNRFDYIIELSGNELNFSRSIQLSKPNGKILWLGNIQKDLNLDKNTVSGILRKEIEIIGSWNSQFKHEDDDWIDSIKLIEDGAVNPSKYITELIQLEELPAFLRKMHMHKTREREHPYIKYCVSNL